MNIYILKEVISKVNSVSKVEPELFGSLRNAINDNIAIFDSKNEFIDTIVAYYKEGELIRLSFAGEKLDIRLQDLIEYLGNYKLAYNFRDNFTQFYFSTDKMKGRVNRVLLKKDNNIEFNGALNSFTEATPKGDHTVYNPESMTFNGFILELI